jgi:hypothetical protein
VTITNLKSVVTMTMLLVVLSSAPATAASKSCGEDIGHYVDAYLSESGTTCHVADVIFGSGVDLKRPSANFRVAQFRCSHLARRVILCVAPRSWVEIVTRHSSA